MPHPPPLGGGTRRPIDDLPVRTERPPLAVEQAEGKGAAREDEPCSSESTGRPRTWSQVRRSEGGRVPRRASEGCGRHLPRERWKADPWSGRGQGPRTAIEALRPRESWSLPRYSLTHAPASRMRRPAWTFAIWGPQSTSLTVPVASWSATSATSAGPLEVSTSRVGPTEATVASRLASLFARREAIPGAEGAALIGRPHVGQVARSALLACSEALLALIADIVPDCLR